jgi:CubicO group peptidase (beta-lactamase class C family)
MADRIPSTTPPASAPAPRPAGLDLSNWRNPPFSAWAFHHVRDLIPCAEIDHAPDHIEPLVVAPRSLAQFRLAVAGDSLELGQFLAATATDALVILHDGAIAYEFYAPALASDTPHIAMSVTKSIVGLVAGILSASGQVDLDAPVSDLVPEIAQTGYHGATLRHLLDMRTGIAFDDRALRDYGTATGWQPTTGEPPTDLREFFATLTAPSGPHGGPFRYVSANTDLLGWALERATGQPIATLISDLLWKPMGAAAPASIALDRGGLARCTGGLSTTARDLARVGQLLVQAGRRGDRAILPADWIHDLADHGSADAWNHGDFAAAFRGRTMRYRGGWYVVDDAPKMLFAMGVHGQNLFVDRDHRLVIAKLSSQGPALDYRAIALTHLAIPELRRCLLAPH